MSTVGIAAISGVACSWLGGVALASAAVLASHGWVGGVATSGLELSSVDLAKDVAGLVMAKRFGLWVSDFVQEA